MRLRAYFSFSDTARAEIYTLSLHDALPISLRSAMFIARYPTSMPRCGRRHCVRSRGSVTPFAAETSRSEEHTSELQSLTNLVCRLLLEKKNEVNAKGVVPPSCTAGVAAH